MLLSRRCNTGYQDGKYSVPAGRLEDEETITDCLVREAREEANLVLTESMLDPPTVLHRMAREGAGSCVDFFFIARRFEGRIHNNEPDKCDDLRFFPVDDLPANTIPYVRFGIDLALRGQPFGEFGWQAA